MFQHCVICYACSAELGAHVLVSQESHFTNLLYLEEYRSPDVRCETHHCFCLICCGSEGLQQLPHAKVID